MDHGQITVRSYSGVTPDEAARAFQIDSEQAAIAGYQPVSQAWQGTNLTVTYRRGPATSGDIAGGGRSLAAIVVIIGGMLGAVGSFLPWITLSTSFDSISQNGIDRGDSWFSFLLGIDGGDGWFSLLLAIGLVLVGVFGAANVRWRPMMWPPALLGSLLLLGLAVSEIGDIQYQVGELDGTIGVPIGIGLWMIAAGAVVATLASFALRRPRSR